MPNAKDKTTTTVHGPDEPVTAQIPAQHLYMLELKHALSLECDGLPGSPGTPVMDIVKDKYGIRANTPEEVQELFAQRVDRIVFGVEAPDHDPSTYADDGVCPLCGMMSVENVDRKRNEYEEFDTDAHAIVTRFVCTKCDQFDVWVEEDTLRYV